MEKIKKGKLMPLFLLQNGLISYNNSIVIENNNTQQAALKTGLYRNKENSLGLDRYIMNQKKWQP